MYYVNKKNEQIDVSVIINAYKKNTRLNEGYESIDITQLDKNDILTFDSIITEKTGNISLYDNINKKYISVKYKNQYLQLKDLVFIHKFTNRAPYSWWSNHYNCKIILHGKIYNSADQYLKSLKLNRVINYPQAQRHFDLFFHSLRQDYGDYLAHLALIMLVKFKQHKDLRDELKKRKDILFVDDSEEYKYNYVGRFLDALKDIFLSGETLEDYYELYNIPTRGYARADISNCNVKRPQLLDREINGDISVTTHNIWTQIHRVNEFTKAQDTDNRIPTLVKHYKPYYMSDIICVQECYDPEHLLTHINKITGKMYEIGSIQTSSQYNIELKKHPNDINPKTDFIPVKNNYVAIFYDSKKLEKVSDNEDSNNGYFKNVIDTDSKKIKDGYSKRQKQWRPYAVVDLKLRNKSPAKVMRVINLHYKGGPEDKPSDDHMKFIQDKLNEPHTIVTGDFNTWSKYLNVPDNPLYYLKQRKFNTDGDVITYLTPNPESHTDRSPRQIDFIFYKGFTSQGSEGFKYHRYENGYKKNIGGNIFNDGQIDVQPNTYLNYDTFLSDHLPYKTHLLFS
jgi:predicted NAD-dependent protein-ADP-ribosyltransferase YbiA (DUF1768 family)